MDILVSIKHEFAEQIFGGVKLVEYRKTKPAKLDYINRMFMYDTSVHAIVGVTTFTSVISGPADKVWEDTADLWHKPTAYQLYSNYVSLAGTVHAFRLGSSPIRFAKPISLQEAGIRRAPQSWCYLTNDITMP